MRLSRRLPRLPADVELPFQLNYHTEPRTKKFRNGHARCTDHRNVSVVVRLESGLSCKPYLVFYDPRRILHPLRNKPRSGASKLDSNISCHCLENKWPSHHGRLASDMCAVDFATGTKPKTGKYTLECMWKI